MIRFEFWLVWVVAAMAAGCSCADEAQELSSKSKKEMTLDLTSYWDGHDFTSLDSFDDIDAAEDKFVGYIDGLSKLPTEEAIPLMNQFLDSASLNVVAYMVWASWAEPLFHSLISPYRNDEIFVAWLDKVLKDKVIDDGAILENLQKVRDFMDVNQSGMQPQNLTLRSESGAELKLTDFKGERTLLLFVDADCPSCLAALSENAKEYEGTDTRLVAILTNGSDYHMSNIRRQLSEQVLQPWTFVYCTMRNLEEGLYDTTLLPFSMLVASDWTIEKSYH